MTKIKKKEKQTKLKKSDKVKKPKDLKNKLQPTKKIKQKKDVLQKTLKTAVHLSQKSTNTAEDKSKTDLNISAEIVKIISKPKNRKKTSPKKEQKIKKVKINSLENKNNADEPSQGEKVHDPEDVERTVFVGNLPPNTKKVQLIKLFSNFGEIKSVRFRSADGIVMFKHKARKVAESINGYVVMKDLKSVENILKLSGIEFKGHHLRITPATKSTQSADTKRIVFIGNLKYSATDEKLFNIFSSCGEIEYVRTLQSNKGCKGVAFVCFKKSESVGLAIELNNTMLDERPIRVERYSKNKLGAREKRREEEDKELKGAAKRIKDKNKKDKNTKNIEKQPLKETKKKSEFRGVQIGFKKKIKKKKNVDKMLQLAKKIAPKS